MPDAGAETGKRVLDYRRRPIAARYMLRALLPSPGRDDGSAPVGARWHGHTLGRDQLRSFSRLAELGVDEGVTLLHPLLVGFRLQMAVLTHRTFPFPIWRSLQTRNRLLQHAPVPTDSPVDLDVVVGGSRLVAKGVEIDLQATVRKAGEPVWEAVTTYYYRRPHRAAAPPPEPPPPHPEEAVTSWRSPGDDAWQMARLTGDYNGVHLWGWYARRLGFARAFHHPHVLIGQCLDRLAPPRGYPQQLDVWIRGPVYRHSVVTLHAGGKGPETSTFALVPEHDHRAAIIGRLGPGS